MEDEPEGRIRVTGPGPLVILGLLGVLVGWGSQHYGSDGDWSDLSISWLVIGALWFIAAVTATIAYLTRRTVLTARADLTAQQGLSRLVLGKTICRVASLGLGLCAGVAISRLGVASENAGDVIVRALIGALGAAGGVAAGLVLEHACRVPPGKGADLP